MNNMGRANYSGAVSQMAAADTHSYLYNLQNFDPPIEGTMRSVCIVQGFELGSNSTVIESIVTNPNTPTSILRRLVTHDEPDIRAALAENRNTPLDTIYALAEDPNPDVRYQLAENHNLPIDLLQQLTQDDNPYVACRAQKTIRRIEEGRASARIGWTAFRRAQSMKGMNEIASSGSAVSFLRKLCRSISGYARAT